MVQLRLHLHGGDDVLDAKLEPVDEYRHVPDDPSLKRLVVKDETVSLRRENLGADAELLGSERGRLLETRVARSADFGNLVRQLILSGHVLALDTVGIDSQMAYHVGHEDVHVLLRDAPLVVELVARLGAAGLLLGLRVDAVKLILGHLLVDRLRRDAGDVGTCDLELHVLEVHRIRILVEVIQEVPGELRGNPVGYLLRVCRVTKIVRIALDGDAEALATEGVHDAVLLSGQAVEGQEDRVVRPLGKLPVGLDDVARIPFHNLDLVAVVPVAADDAVRHVLLGLHDDDVLAGVPRAVGLEGDILGRAADDPVPAVVPVEQAANYGVLREEHPASVAGTRDVTYKDVVLRELLSDQQRTLGTSGVAFGGDDEHRFAAFDGPAKGSVRFLEVVRVGDSGIIGHALLLLALYEIGLVAGLSGKILQVDVTCALPPEGLFQGRLVEFLAIVVERISPDVHHHGHILGDELHEVVTRMGADAERVDLELLDVVRVHGEVHLGPLHIKRRLHLRGEGVEHVMELPLDLDVVKTAAPVLAHRLLDRIMGPVELL